MKSMDLYDHVEAKKAQALQNTYIKAAMKVLARFPDLVLERDPDRPMVRYQPYGPKWSAFPFKYSEPRLPNDPLGPLFKILCTRKGRKSELVEADHEERGIDGTMNRIAEDDEENDEDDDG